MLDRHGLSLAVLLIAFAVFAGILVHNAGHPHPYSEIGTALVEPAP